MRTLVSADDGVIGRELWSFAGADLAPRLVLDAAPGAAGSAARMLGPLADGRVAVGLAGGELWVTDGSGPGTLFVTLAPDSAFTEAGAPWFAPGLGPLPNGTLLIGLHRILFWGPDNVEVRTAWATDGTAGGTREGVGLGGNLSLALSGGRLLVSGVGPSRDELPYCALVVTDGTSAGTPPLVVGQGWFVSPIALGDDAAIFALDDLFLSGDLNGAWERTGAEPWITDGTPEDTRRLKDIPRVRRLPSPPASWPSATGGRCSSPRTACMAANPGSPTARPRGRACLPTCGRALPAARRAASCWGLPGRCCWRRCPTARR